MQDWDTRIKNLKTDIQIAREKYVVPFLNAKPKTPPAPKEVIQTPDPSLGAMVDNEEVVGEKIYENKDPVSSLDLIDKTNNTEKNQNVGLTEEINEAIASADDSKAEESLEGEVKKTELELLEERDENELSEEEEDRMYELRRLRAQKNMNNEVREAEQAELKKADEEIAHLKTLLKPKPKKLPKGYIA